MSAPVEIIQSIRVDKWLWAARFYKTRSLATQAINGGKVHLNGNRIKPGRQLASGDLLSIQKGLYRFDVKVEQLTSRRSPADEAHLLYNESEASEQTRHSLYKQCKLKGNSARYRARRPDQRTRRMIRQFKQQ